MCILCKAVYETQRKMGSKGMQKGKVNSPDAEASAERDVVPTRLRDPNTMTASQGTGLRLH